MRLVSWRRTPALTSSLRRAMHIPTVRGLIERRLLVNYRVRPNILAKLLPAPFRPQLVGRWGMAGICLIRLKQVRPQGLPGWVGISSENAAHRIAVEWDECGTTRQGVFVHRRDTDSRWNALVGGRIFPGVHHHAMFKVHETAKHYSVAIRSDDGETLIALDGSIGHQLTRGSAFGSLAAASEFFQAGSLGYSPASNGQRFQGLELRCREWHVEPLDIESVRSNFFDDSCRFPPDAAEFDCALLMRNIQHEWHGRKELVASSAEAWQVRASPELRQHYEGKRSDTFILR